MQEKEDQQIRIPKDKHHIVAFYCKFKGISMKKYICKRLDADPELSQFQKRVKELVFK